VSFKINRTASCLSLAAIFFLTSLYQPASSREDSAQQPTAPQASAPQAGVLLGYAQFRPDERFEYETMWIVFSPTEAHVAASVPDIIVPRSTGFWRLGTTVACEFSADNQQDSAREVVWQTPVDKAPAFKQGPLCKNHKPGDSPDSGEEAGAADSNAGHVPLCAKETAKLYFVSPTHVAEEFDDFDACDARGGRDITRDDVRSIDASEPISLADLFGERAAKSYAAAEKKGFAENNQSYNCPEPDAERFDLKSWHIAHRRGAWTPMASLNELPGECAFFYQTDLTLPKTITGEISKAELWKSFAAAVPHLEDFFLSPLGDYALILVSPKNADHHLYAYSIQNGAAAKRLAEIPWENSNSHPVVMAQWSSAKYVPQWTSAIQKIQDHPLPAAIPHAEEATAAH
jgi:hypothetical protein